MGQEYEPPPMSGPYQNPIDRYLHLPTKTRRFLEELRDDDIEDIRTAIKWAKKMHPIREHLAELRPEDFADLKSTLAAGRWARDTGRFFKKLILACLAVIAGTALLPEQFAKIGMFIRAIFGVKS